MDLDYQLGIEAGMDTREAGKHLKKSFDNGNIDAMFTYAELLKKSVGKNLSVTPFKKAIESYRIASLHGHEHAKLMLATCLFTGVMTKISVGESLSLFKELAEKENKQAMTHLAITYYEGYYIEQDYKKAFELCEKVVNGKYKTSYQVDLFSVSKLKSGVITTDFTTLHDENYCQHLLGEMYLKGHGIEQDFDKSFELFSTNKEQLYSTFYVGYMYENGLSVKKDINKAIEIYKSLEKCEHYQAQYRLKVLKEELSNFDEIYDSLNVEYFIYKPQGSDALSGTKHGVAPLMSAFLMDLVKKGPTAFAGYPYSQKYSDDLEKKLEDNGLKTYELSINNIQKLYYNN